MQRNKKMYNCIQSSVFIKSIIQLSLANSKALEFELDILINTKNLYEIIQNDLLNSLHIIMHNTTFIRC